MLAKADGQIINFNSLSNFLAKKLEHNSLPFDKINDIQLT